MITAALMILAWAGFAGTVITLRLLRHARAQLAARDHNATVYDLTSHRQGRNT